MPTPAPPQTTCPYPARGIASETKYSQCNVWLEDHFHFRAFPHVLSGLYQTIEFGTPYVMVSPAPLVSTQLSL